MDSRIRRLVDTVRARGQNLRRRGRRPLGATPTATQPARNPRLAGMVEQFSRRLVVGWVSVPKGSSPVLVTLHLGPLKVASTYATPGESMSGAGSSMRSGTPPAPVTGKTSPAETAQPMAHSWQLPNIAGPRDDRRNSRQEIHTFSFRVRGIWSYVKKSTQITVRVRGEALPIVGHGMFLQSPRNGKESLKDLREKLDRGYLFSQFGQLQLSKQLDEVWQGRVMNLYDATRAIVADSFGYDVFFIYGTLLGAVRERGYIGHDVDFDAAYLSRHSTGAEAAEELEQIALTLIERGMDVLCVTGALHIHDPEDPETRIDLFHTYFDEQDNLSFPFGIAGTTTVTRDDWCGTRHVEFPGGRGLVPANAEQIVEHLYGADWRRPKPGFNWNLDRTGSATQGLLSTEQRDKVYWANFYAHTEYNEGSTFFEFVNARSDTPRSIVDIGCGDGRDSCAFGAVGRTVLGLDQSQVGVEHARKHAAAAKLDGDVSFHVCDVGDALALGALLTDRMADSEEPVMFYLRFFLHSISDEVQQTLLGVVNEHARPGDLFAAEFRTDKDEERSKVHGRHYRRFQNGAEFGRRLAGAYGFHLLHEEESAGLSPYQGEDPVLYRVVARR